MEERSCQICNSTKKEVHICGHLPPDVDISILHSQYFRSKEHWRYQVMICKECGHYYASPVFDQKLIEQSYIQQDHDNEYGMSDDLISRTNRGYVDLVAKHLGTVRGSMLDIGCDTGRFLEQAQILGFKKHIGVEPSQNSILKALALPNTQYIGGAFNPENFASGSMDLITMIHVLDHVSKPQDFLKCVTPLLSPGGVLFAIVHNIDSLLAKISGPSWHPFNLIHFDYYTKKSLAALAEKCGLSTLGTYNTHNYVDLQQIFDRAPFLPPPIRSAGIKITQNSFLKYFYCKIPLGNIAIVAQKSY